MRQTLVLLTLFLAAAPLRAAPSPAPAGDASPAASPRSIAGVGLDVSLSKERRRKFITDVEDGGFSVLAYNAVKKGAALHIWPSLAPFEALAAAGNAPIVKGKDHLRALREGGTIQSVHSSELSFEFPCLDIKVLNNGKRTLLFTEVLLVVKKSTPDLSPVIFLESGYDQIQLIHLENGGWGRVDGGRMDFDIWPLNAKQPTGKRRFHRALGPFTTECDILLTAELKAVGVDADLLGAEGSLQLGRAKLEAAMGKLLDRPKTDDDFDPGYYVYAGGELELDWKDAQGAAKKTRVKFKAKILITPPDGLGAPGPVQGAYEALLEPDRADYTVRVPITQEARPGAMTRFALTVGSLRSATHDMAVRLATADGGVVESGPIRLDLVLTRGCAGALAKGTAKEAPAEEEATTSEGAEASPEAPPSAAPSASPEAGPGASPGGAPAAPPAGSPSPAR